MRGKVLTKDDRVRWFISSANRDPNMSAADDVRAERNARREWGLLHRLRRALRRA
jgi:hypothetical protein